MIEKRLCNFFFILLKFLRFVVFANRASQNLDLIWLDFKLFVFFCFRISKCFVNHKTNSLLVRGTNHEEQHFMNCIYIWICWSRIHKLDELILTKVYLLLRWVHDKVRYDDLVLTWQVCIANHNWPINLVMLFMHVLRFIFIIQS